MIGACILWLWWAICEFADLRFNRHGVPEGSKRKPFRRWRGSLLLAMSLTAGVTFYLESIQRVDVNYLKVSLLLAIPLAGLYILNKIYFHTWLPPKNKK